MTGPRDRPDLLAHVGLCSVCRHVRVQRSARGSAFYRCARAARDPRFRPYPPLPVEACSGFEEAAAEAAQGRAERSTRDPS